MILIRKKRVEKVMMKMKKSKKRSRRKSKKIRQSTLKSSRISKIFSLRLVFCLAFPHLCIAASRLLAVFFPFHFSWGPFCYLSSYAISFFRLFPTSSPPRYFSFPADRPLSLLLFPPFFSVWPLCTLSSSCAISPSIMSRPDRSLVP